MARVINPKASPRCQFEQTCEVLKTRVSNPSYWWGPGWSLAMKGVLFLSLVGAAIYMALVVSHDQLPTDRADDSVTRQSSSGPPDRQLRSWGTDLSSLVSSRAASLPLRKPGVVLGSLETPPAQASAVVADSLRRRRKRQLSCNPTGHHTSRLNGQRLCLPRERIVKPLFRPRPSGSISLVRLCRLSAARTAGFR